MQDSQPPKRDTGPNALRRGRHSLPGACYFVTLCVQPRRPVLTSPIVATALFHQMHQLTKDECWRLRCATVMPDHVHLFITLGGRLTLSQTIARLKSMTRALVRSGGADWQENFFDHRLREEDALGCVIRYIHLNPYRSGLITVGEVWPYFFCDDEDWEWYRQMTDDSCPPLEWLG